MGEAGAKKGIRSALLKPDAHGLKPPPGWLTLPENRYDDEEEGT